MNLSFGRRYGLRLATMGAACIGGVLIALLGQHVFGMRPCAWCILQRFIFLLLGLVCIVGSVLHAAWDRRAMAGLALVLSGLGIAAAIYQHEVAAKLASCNLTLADKVVNALRLESLWPAMFQVTANCADAHVTMLGLPYERWSLSLFSIVALVSLTLLRWPKYRR